LSSSADTGPIYVPSVRKTSALSVRIERESGENGCFVIRRMSKPAYSLNAGIKSTRVFLRGLFFFAGWSPA